MRSFSLRFAGVLGLAAALAVVAPAALAQSYPDKQVRLVVPFPAGGVTDVLGRLVAQKLSERWGQPVVVENRAGAGGNVGTEFGARAVPDGYTLTLGSIATAISQSLYKNLRYDMQRDFRPVSMLVTSDLVLLANPSFPVRDAAELVAYAKANPGKVDYASSGNGTSFHLAGTMLATAADIRMQHVPFAGGAPAMTALIGGQVPIMFNNVVDGMVQVKNGKLKALAVTGAKRSATAPNVPTMVEQGFRDFVVTPWFGIMVPKATPDAVVRKLNADINEVLRQADVRERLLQLGAEPAGGTSEAFDAFARAEVDRWAKAVKASGASIE
ncbi:MAG: tripartite tricarboxylate transporter substrate binding protein [Pseudomonadota bacterium]